MNGFQVELTDNGHRYGNFGSRSAATIWATMEFPRRCFIIIDPENAWPLVPLPKYEGGECGE